MRRETSGVGGKEGAWSENPLTRELSYPLFTKRFYPPLHIHDAGTWLLELKAGDLRNYTDTTDRHQGNKMNISGP